VSGEFVVRSEGVSRVLTEIMIVVIVIAMISAFAAQQTNLLSSLGQSPALDLSASQAWVNPVDGSGQILLKVRNSGTGTLRIKSITFAAKEVAMILFTGGKPMFNSTTTFKTQQTGQEYTDSNGAGITSDGYLFVPGGARVTLEFTFSAQLSSVFNAGSTYKLTVETSGEVYSSTLTFSG
jgi:hypothetical protein